MQTNVDDVIDDIIFYENLKNHHNTSKHTLQSRKKARNLSLYQNTSFSNRIHLH